MKTAIIITDGVKQINFTPENDSERQALKMIAPDDNIELAVKSGSFFGSTGSLNHSNQPFSVDVNECHSGYLRAFNNEESIMLVLRPKKQQETVKDCKPTDIPIQRRLEKVFKLMNPSAENITITNKDREWELVDVTIDETMVYMIEQCSFYFDRGNPSRSTCLSLDQMREIIKIMDGHV